MYLFVVSNLKSQLSSFQYSLGMRLVQSPTFFKIIHCYVYMTLCITETLVKFGKGPGDETNLSQTEWLVSLEINISLLGAP